MTSPYELIPPPIKRSRILVSGGVEVVISVNLYVIKSVAANACGCAYPAGKFPFPDILRPEQKVAASNHYFRLFTTGLSLLVFQFQLITSGFSLKLLCALLERTNRFDSQHWPPKGICSCKLTNSKLTLIITGSVRAAGVPKRA
jgi:hypothetical protein